MENKCSKCRGEIYPESSPSTVLCVNCLYEAPYRIGIKFKSKCVMYSHPPYGNYSTRDQFIHSPGCTICKLGRLLSAQMCQTFSMQCDSCMNFHNMVIKDKEGIDYRQSIRVWKLRVENEIRLKTRLMRSILRDLMTKDWEEKLKKSIWERAPHRPSEMVGEIVKFPRGWPGLNFGQHLSLRLTDGIQKSIASTRNDLPCKSNEAQHVHTMQGKDDYPGLI